MVGQIILAVICGLLLGDCIGICIRQLIVRFKLKRRVKRADLLRMSSRVNGTYQKLIRRDFMALVIETLIVVLLAIILIGNKINLDIKGITVICFAIIVTITRIIRLINTLYIINTLTNILSIGIDSYNVMKDQAMKEKGNKRIDSQLAVCESNMRTLYYIVDRVKSKKDYDNSPELISNIEKAKKDIEKLGNMLKG